jgi:hypothetical protein
MGGEMEIELKKNGVNTGIYVSLECKTFMRSPKRNRRDKAPPKLVEITIESGRGFETARKRIRRE